ncbi:CbiX/SirB N-terminal domain-containing protein [Massilia terrae]|uniref:CbiX/SirB N-terminal domain-containing protein n=1 Tax=Massilia terrae TaxID=1811224 RepID=A0ABT2D4P4_9BURK|nr:CbiX/SirB N-terminal domain-containing protein [Massilia terrae]MCS0661211.1 CbiX/SirB N-terminal domain-containing protein [Massilia terrae]
MASRALILFAHGARSAGWAEPFERLRDMTAARVDDCEVSLAFLELMAPSLPDEVAAMAARGITRISIVPVFLGLGGHLQRDLPALVERLRTQHPQLSIDVAGPVGEDAGVLAAMADYCVTSLS